MPAEPWREDDGRCGSKPGPAAGGDAAVAQIAALLADRTRAQVLLALANGHRPGDALSAPLATNPYRLVPAG